MVTKFFLQAASPLHKAVNHVLTTILAIPAEFIITEGDYFAVKEGPNVYMGLLPLLSVLRRRASDESHIAFLGSANPVTAAAVNQWVAVAAQLSTDADFMSRAQAALQKQQQKQQSSLEDNKTEVATVNSSAARYHSVFSTVADNIERQIFESSLSSSFLCGTPRATVADVLLYAAVNEHPVVLSETASEGTESPTTAKKGAGLRETHQIQHPFTMIWSQFVEADAFVAPVKSAYVGKHAVAAASPSKNSKALIKPSAEEIERRRMEKEALRAQKATEKAAATSVPVSESTTGSKKGGSKGEGKASTAATDDPQTMVLLVGRIKAVRPHPDADRLYVEDMDLGGEDQRTIVSGLVEHYKTEELKDRLCLVIANMKPRALKGMQSQGMVLCASNDAGLTLITPPAEAKPGDRVLFGPANYAYAQLEAETTAKPPPPKQLSGAVLTEVLSHLRTDGEGFLVWKETVAILNSGAVVVPDRINAEVR